jgi:hypothetical protein
LTLTAPVKLPRPLVIFDLPTVRPPPFIWMRTGMLAPLLQVTVPLPDAVL